jgi:hypothetical protein
MTISNAASERKSIFCTCRERHLKRALAVARRNNAMPMIVLWRCCGPVERDLGTGIPCELGGSSNQEEGK